MCRRPDTESNCKHTALVEIRPALPYIRVLGSGALPKKTASRTGTPPAAAATCRMDGQPLRDGDGDLSTPSAAAAASDSPSALTLSPPSRPPAPSSEAKQRSLAELVDRILRQQRQLEQLIRSVDPVCGSTMDGYVAAEAAGRKDGGLLLTAAADRTVTLLQDVGGCSSPAIEAVAGAGGFSSPLSSSCSREGEEEDEKEDNNSAEEGSDFDTFPIPPAAAAVAASVAAAVAAAFACKEPLEHDPFTGAAAAEMPAKMMASGDSVCLPLPPGIAA